MRLLIVSHVIHFMHQGRLYAYGPYAREIDLWADLFAEVRIASPCRTTTPPSDCVPFTRTNISIVPQLEAGGSGLIPKLKLFALTPFMLLQLSRAMRNADAIHVRCPGNIGLLGVILAPLFSRRLVAKYAGQWSDVQGEPWSVRLQKALLASRYWRGPVTIYGRWPNQPRHVISFFPALLTQEHLTRASVAARNRRYSDVLRVLYTGRLSKAKNVDILLHAVAAAADRGVRITCNVVGDGPERPNLEALASALGIAGLVSFKGGVSFDEVHQYLESADVLVLVSEAEGWAKSLTEGMAFGLVCIGANRGFTPYMLSEGRGVVIEPGLAEPLTELFVDIASHPETYRRMRALASAWASSYSMESLKEAIQELLEQHWNVTFDSIDVPARAI